MAAIVYVIINDAMPGLVKIGLTTTSLEQRMIQLDTTGVPLPFKCYYAAEVANADFVESKLHIAFGDFRVRNNREWFRVDPFRVKAALEIATLADVTPKVEVLGDPNDVVAIEANSTKASRFKMSSANVPIGAVLTFAQDPSMTAKVLDDTTIDFEGTPMSLSKSALIVMNRLGYAWKAIQGPLYWMYEGETLFERRNNLEEA